MHLWIVGVHKSTISREIRRNRGLRGYRPKQAHHLAQRRWVKSVSTRIPQPTWSLVRRLLPDDWSPEQISGWLDSEHHITVSQESIYQFVLKFCNHELCLCRMKHSFQQSNVLAPVEIGCFGGFPQSLNDTAE